jgi:DNA-binding transcriptional LysR family regulator
MPLDWDKLRVFYSVAQAGSFTKAGNNLSLSQSAISRQISGLEESLNIALFHRHSRGLILTEQGEILYKAAQDIFSKLAAAENAITESRERPRGQLKITMPVTLGTTWLTPRMHEFVELYPEIQITMIADDKELDLTLREADVAIRLFKPKNPDLIYRQLVTFHNYVYVSKSYIQKHGIPKNVDDLYNHRIIIYGEESRAPFENINWLSKTIFKNRTDPLNFFRVNNLFGMLKAVETGIGIAALPDFMVKGNDQIIRILDGLQGSDIDIYFVYPSELRKSKRVNVFRDFILRKVSELA